MNRTHDEIRDLLDAYALRALDDAEREEVERHLAGCEPCRAAALEVERVVDAIPEALGERAPSPALRERLLVAAREDVAARRPLRSLSLPRLRPSFALGLALVLVAGGSLWYAADTGQRLVAVQTQLERDTAIRSALAQSRASWYMAGADTYRGSGGWLVQAKSGDVSFVLFHDLRPLPADRRYAVWLIAPSGKWVRAANFTPSGERLQRIDVPDTVDDYVQCAVTVEAADSGPRSGPVAMQSKLTQ